jgi:biopolymer transport protein ExbB
MGNQRSLSQKLVWFVVASLLWTSLATGYLARSAKAAEEGEKAAAAPAAEGKAVAKAEGEGEGEGKPQESFLWWVIKTSGLIGLVILILSIYFVATVCRLFYEMRMPIAIPPDVVAKVDELLQQRDYKQVFNVVKEDDSHFSRMLSTGIAELPNGLAEARDVMERVGEAIHVENEKKISILAVMGTLGPMIGLLGTLQGMIGAFSVIARSDQQLKASEVAKGISEALLLTFEGVALSVPAIYFFSVFRNRIMHNGTQASLEADQFLRHFAHSARSKAPGGAPAAQGAPATPPAKPAK